MQPIVVGVDGSKASLDAVEMAAALVRALPDAELVVVHSIVVPISFHRRADGEHDSALAEAVERKIRDGVEDRLEGTDTPWRFERRHGEPARELSSVARDLGARLVVIGRSGLGNWNEVALGSVSNRLVHRMDCPVLFV
jgi:nucleotide-binding universal stress UspA family protein